MTTIGIAETQRIHDAFNAQVTVVMNQIALVKTLIEDNNNEAIHTEINDNEHIIDSLEMEMRNEVIKVIVLYSPRASYLRKIMSYYDMTAYLERIGDLLFNISDYLRKSAVKQPLFRQYEKNISKMLAIVGEMTQNAIFAFTCEDSNLAQATIELDDKVDALQYEIVRQLQISYEKVRTEQNMIDILCINSMAYNMERIGDNATNIAEAAIYLMEGKDVKHHLFGDDIGVLDRMKDNHMNRLK